MACGADLGVPVVADPATAGALEAIVVTVEPGGGLQVAVLPGAGQRERSTPP